ncbi:MAG: hypothetical protein WCF28_03835 [Methanobacterium sp.]|uniref:hypothetical protein n=1 Tax=Methanobacterium sp. TaxID=2164 RepID=UPI003C74C381
MKNIWNKIIIIVGILCIILGVMNGYSSFISAATISNTGNIGNGFNLFIVILGFIMIYYSRASLKLHTNEENKFNFRETDSKDNCLKCKCCNPKSLTECRFFHIEIDENHVCDLLEPQIEEEMLKNQDNVIINN